MISYLLLLVVVCARYQYFAEKDIFDIVTLPKTEALQYFSSDTYSSYIITKQRHKYNCTYSPAYKSGDNSKSSFLMISKDILKQMTFSGDGQYGKVSIHPLNKVILNKHDSTTVFEIDQNVAPEERFGEKHQSSAKYTEFYKYKEGDDTVQKMKISYSCQRSVIFEEHDLLSLAYSLSVTITKSSSLSVSISSNAFCIDQDEDNGFKEINKKLYDSSDNSKSQFKVNGWQYSIFHKQNITQQFIATEAKYNLGFYNMEATKAQGYNVVRRFRPSEPEDAYLNLIYDNGDECATTGKKRRTNLRLVCPNDSGVLTDYVIETSHCNYEMFTSASWVCNLPWMKKPIRHKRSIVCYDIEEN